MLKKQITYTDLNDQTVTEEYCFHLSKAELIELELSIEGGLEAHLKKIVESENGKAIMETFKKLVLDSYGQRSEDGRRFIKSDALREMFKTSEAYSELFMELATDAEAAANFVNGILPANLDKTVENLTKQDAARSVVESHLDDSPASARVISRAEMN